MLTSIFCLSSSEDLTADDEPPPAPVAVANADDLEKELDLVAEEDEEDTYNGEVEVKRDDDEAARCDERRADGCEFEKLNTIFCTSF